VPLLARMLPAPLHVDVRAGALDDVPELIADGRISRAGRFALVVGSGLGAEVVARLGGALDEGCVFVVGDDRVETAMTLADDIRRRRVDVVVAVGGGRTLDVAKHASSRVGLPMLAVATSLAHDGIASPVSVLSVGDGRASFGVAMPVGVVVDLELVERSPEHMLRAGVGDVISNLGALADWRLGQEHRGEAVDGLAASFAGTAARSVLEHRGPTRSRDFLACLADALILSGMAMAVAGTSRPCSGACHEISHAIDELFPGAATHGEQVGLGALFSFVLRGDDDMARAVASCLRRHGLPTSPLAIGLAEDDFVKAVLHAPSTRPERFTILEHLEPSWTDLIDALRRMEVLCFDLLGATR
jgi:glycerol-1-phosphate dehydrogenase [NAD(P)+]